MPSARYWRLVGCKPYGYGADLSLSEVALYAGATRVDTGLACPYTPSSGSLSNLADGSTSSVCTFTPASFDKSNFALTWDLGSAQDVTSIDIGSAANKSSYLAEGLLQASSNGSIWTSVSRIRGLTYPGANALTSVANFKVVDPTFLARFDGTNGAQSISNAYGSTPTFTFSTGVALSTAQKYSGTASMYFPGTDKLLYSSTQPHAASFIASTQQSMSAWIYYDNASYLANSLRVGSAWDTYSSNTAQEGWVLAVNASGGLDCTLFFNNAFPGSPSVTLSSAAASIPLQTWTHVAWDRRGDNFWLYINGQVVDSETLVNAGTFAGLATRQFAIGCTNANTSNTPWKGYIDEYMLLNGAAIFGGLPFTPGAWIDQTGDSPSAYTASPDVILDSRTFDKILFSNPTTNTQAKITDVQAVRRDLYFGGNGVVNGTVKEKSTPSNIPLYRRVRLIDQRSGNMVAETWSNATTGAYTFANIDRSRKYTVVSYDHTGFYRAVIADNLTPDLMS